MLLRCEPCATTALTICSHFPRQQTLGDSRDYQAASQWSPVCQQTHQGLTPVTIVAFREPARCSQLMALQEICCSLARRSAPRESPVPRGSWAKALAQPGLRQVSDHCMSPDCSSCWSPGTCPRGVSAPRLLPPPLPFPQDPTEGVLWTDWLPAAVFVLDHFFTAVVLLPKARPALQGSTRTSAAVKHPPSQRCPTGALQVPKAGVNLKQSTEKRPPLPLYSKPIILAAPLPASRLLRSPPTPHYQPRPKALSPAPSFHTSKDHGLSRLHAARTLPNPAQSQRNSAAEDRSVCCS